MPYRSCMEEFENMKLTICGDLPAVDISGIYPVHNEPFWLNWYIKGEEDGVEFPLVALAGGMSLMMADVLTKALKDKEFMKRAGYGGKHRPLPNILT